MKYCMVQDGIVVISCYLVFNLRTHWIIWETITLYKKYAVKGWCLDCFFWRYKCAKFNRTPTWQEICPDITQTWSTCNSMDSPIFLDLQSLQSCSFPDHWSSETKTLRKGWIQLLLSLLLHSEHILLSPVSAAIFNKFIIIRLIM